MTGRKYSSPLREQQAERTRRRIVETARSLFTKLGFAETTISMIAAEAGVSEPTIYGTFQSKGGLLRGLLEHLEQDADVDHWQSRIVEEADPEAKIALFAEWSAELFGRSHDVLVAALGARQLPEMAEFWDRGEYHRRVAVKRVVEGVDQAGRIRVDLTSDEAIDRVWALSGPEVYALARDGCGWTDDHYVAWLTELITQQVLAD